MSLRFHDSEVKSKLHFDPVYIMAQVKTSAAAVISLVTSRSSLLSGYQP